MKVVAPQSGAIFMSERLGLNSNPNLAWIKEGMEEEAGKISVNTRQYLSIYIYIDVNCITLTLLVKCDWHFGFDFTVLTTSLKREIIPTQA